MPSLFISLFVSPFVYTILGRVRELLINSEKADTPLVFDRDVDRFMLTIFNNSRLLPNILGILNSPVALDSYFQNSAGKYMGTSGRVFFPWIFILFCKSSLSAPCSYTGKQNYYI